MAARSLGLWRLFQLILPLLPAVCWAYEVFDIVEGKLAAEEANHYTVDARGVLVGIQIHWVLYCLCHVELVWNCVLPVALVTEEGDADIYASIDVKEPGHGNSQFSSCTCGFDLVVVPSRKEEVHLQRVYLSVVGHTRHEESRYKMFIIAPANEDLAKYQVERGSVQLLR